MARIKRSKRGFHCLLLEHACRLIQTAHWRPKETCHLRVKKRLIHKGLDIETVPRAAAVIAE